MLIVTWEDIKLQLCGLRNLECRAARNCNKQLEIFTSQQRQQAQIYFYTCIHSVLYICCFYCFNKRNFGVASVEHISCMLFFLRSLYNVLANLAMKASEFCHEVFVRSSRIKLDEMSCRIFSNKEETERQLFSAWRVECVCTAPLRRLLHIMQASQEVP